MATIAREQTLFLSVPAKVALYEASRCAPACRERGILHELLDRVGVDSPGQVSLGSALTQYIIDGLLQWARTNNPFKGGDPEQKMAFLEYVGEVIGEQRPELLRGGFILTVAIETLDGYLKVAGFSPDDDHIAELVQDGLRLMEDEDEKLAFRRCAARVLNDHFAKFISPRN